MNSKQPIGGARTVTPIDDENCYPLSEDEFLTLEENINNNTFSNWESFLLTLGVTALLSFVIALATLDLEVELKQGEVKSHYANISVLILYGSIAFGGIIAFFIVRSAKKKSKNVITRLISKISTHLEKKS